MSEKKPPEGKATYLAELLGVSSRKIRDMAQRGVVVKIRRGVFDLRSSIRQYYEEELQDKRQDCDGKKESTSQEISSTELANLLGISPRWIQKLTAEGVLKKGRTEKYRTAEAVQKYCDYLRKSSKSNQGDLDAETLRLTRAKADKAEIGVEILRGETVRTEAVAQVWGDLVTVFRSRVLRIPAKLAATLALKSDPAEIQEYVMEEMRDALEDLAKFDPEEVIERALPEDPEDDGPPSEPDGIGMGK